MLGLIAGNWRLWGILAAAGGLLLLGWKVAGWRADAANYHDLYNQASKDRIKAEASAASFKRERDEARGWIAAYRLKEAEEKTHARTKEIIKRVVVKVPDDSHCDLNADVVRELDTARGNVSEAAPAAPAASPEPAATEAKRWWNPF